MSATQPGTNPPFNNDRRSLILPHNTALPESTERNVPETAGSEFPQNDSVVPSGQVLQRIEVNVIREKPNRSIAEKNMRSSRMSRCQRGVVAGPSSAIDDTSLPDDGRIRSI